MNTDHPAYISNKPMISGAEAQPMSQLRPC